MSDQHATEVISCTQLGKRYRLYHRPSDRLLDSLYARWQRLLGRRSRNSTREFRALDNVSFSLAHGEAMAIIGRNGSGKSTLLQLIAGTLDPTEGSIQVNGRVCAMLELGVGFNPEFNGVENARLYALMLGIPHSVIEERLPAILAFAEIGEFALQPVKNYSSGMYVRLAFAVIAHADPEVLIVDEALSVGDAAFQAKCMFWLRNFQKAGGSLLFVSHDIAAVRAICHRALYLEQGRVKAEGPTGEVTDLYLHDIHQSQNSALVPRPAILNQVTPPCEQGDEAFRLRSNAFEQRWIDKRQGTGDSRIRLVELLTPNGEPIGACAFNAEAIVRIHVECMKTAQVSVNYKIRDRHLVSVVGADFLISGHPLLEMRPGELHCIEYRTRLPLMNGDYSLRLSVTEPIEKHAQAVFHDIIEVALSFKVLPAEQGWIYTMAYLPNTVSVQPQGCGSVPIPPNTRKNPDYHA
ncbi:ABC transporter ATP-binding protein [Pseudomonas sp. PB120]|uniref:ABC transporter ATP-binding protein n=1 Tax=Pseudomonas sp. PB120 TaxID=2494700 RepID=UPI0012FDC77A|nr:ABC transporter ATP-binding protein [Pseudomonas sp. PB120]MVV52328.1 ABC transporter ATP-binding protein [Pseudomonas sp. PB120]